MWKSMRKWEVWRSVHASHSILSSPYFPGAVGCLLLLPRGYTPQVVPAQKSREVESLMWQTSPLRALDKVGSLPSVQPDGNCPIVHVASWRATGRADQEAARWHTATGL